MTLLPKLDEKQTKKNARGVLNQYRKWQRIAGRPLIDIKSPIITDMPKGTNRNNKAENALLERLDAEFERDAIITALAALPVASRQVLYYCFCDVEKRSNLWIGFAIGYSERQIERIKSDALIEFAESYRKGRLLSTL